MPPADSSMGNNSTRQDLPLSGYADRLSARPGESLDIKVSSLSQQPYQASLVRVRYADPNPEGPGVKPVSYTHLTLPTKA